MIAMAMALMIVGGPVVAEPTFSSLPEATRKGIPIRLDRPSNEIPASPFATMGSPEVWWPQEDDGVVDTMRALGIKHIVMQNLHGNVTDPKDPRLTHFWERCRDAGIEVRAILHSTDLKLWEQALRNWGDRITYWSYLNEPNSPTNNDHTHPAFMPDRYVEGIREVRKLRDRVAPQVKLGGPDAAMLQCMEETPWPWLRLCLEAGLSKEIDFFSYHPYRQGYSPRNIPEYPSRFFQYGTMPKEYSTYEGQITELRRRVGNMPLAVNECGWSTTPTGSICEHTQAKFALRQQIEDFSLGIECAVYFMLRERHVDAPCPLWNIENHFGIVHVDNTPKPAYKALQALYAQIDNRDKPSKVTVRISLTGLPHEMQDVEAKWFLYEDETDGVRTRKLLYWLPVAAQDEFPAVKAQVRVGDVVVGEVPIDDAPQILRVHEIDGKWGWPVRIDMIKHEIDQDVAWRRG
jgi:hypothetical protein